MPKKKLSDFYIKNGMDIPFFVIMLIILAIGLVMLLSSSYIYAFHFAEDGNSLYYFNRQLFFAVVGVIGIWFASHLNYKYLKKIAFPLWLFAVGLVTVALFQNGDNEIRRWLYIGSFGFQPSELAKCFLIIYCAHGLERDRKKLLSDAPSKAGLIIWLRNKTNGKINLKISSSTVTFFKFLCIIGLTTLPVIASSHLSGTILMVLIGVSMLWLGECKARWFVIGGILATIVVVFVIFNYEDVPVLRDYMAERIKAWLIKDYEPGDARWQINHSLYALGSGGLLGSGIGNSKQKYLYVSECHTDFIFSIVGEELGFVGCFIILALFALLICRGVYIGMRSKDRFGALLSFGMVAQLGLQVMFNIAVITDTVPNTGIPLPFFSYGVTALWITLFEMGVILSVSRQADLKKVYSFKKKKVKEPA